MVGSQRGSSWLGTQVNSQGRLQGAKERTWILFHLYNLTNHLRSVASSSDFSFHYLFFKMHLNCSHSPGRAPAVRMHSFRILYMEAY